MDERATMMRMKATDNQAVPSTDTATTASAAARTLAIASVSRTMNMREINTLISEETQRLAKVIKSLKQVTTADRTN